MEDMEPIQKLNRDLKKAAATLTATEARYLVDAYYIMQRDRIRADHQGCTLAEAGEPNALLGWFSENTATLERNIKSALGTYSKAHPVGKWAESIIGIGPVISAGLLAHIDMEPWRCQRVKEGSPFFDKSVKKACTPKEPHGPECHHIQIPTVGHIWRFAGLDPTVTWGEGQKRPWNGALKRLCWIMGESFTKQQSHKDDFYGKLYLHRKAQEESKNANHDFADQAAAALKEKNWRRDTKTKAAYEDGLLPQARIHLRSQRYAVKIFLAHWFAVAYRNKHGVKPPKPYVIEHLGHTHEIQVPNYPWPD